MLIVKSRALHEGARIAALSYLPVASSLYYDKFIIITYWAIFGQVKTTPTKRHNGRKKKTFDPLIPIEKNLF